MRLRRGELVTRRSRRRYGSRSGAIVDRGRVDNSNGGSGTSTSTGNGNGRSSSSEPNDDKDGVDGGVLVGTSVDFPRCAVPLLLLHARLRRYGDVLAHPPARALV